jgi:hypothetical protein
VDSGLETDFRRPVVRPGLAWAILPDHLSGPCDWFVARQGGLSRAKVLPLPMERPAAPLGIPDTNRCRKRGREKQAQNNVHYIPPFKCIKTTPKCLIWPYGQDNISFIWLQEVCGHEVVRTKPAGCRDDQPVPRVQVSAQGSDRCVPPQACGLLERGTKAKVAAPLRPTAQRYRTRDIAERVGGHMPKTASQPRETVLAGRFSLSERDLRWLEPFNPRCEPPCASWTQPQPDDH